MTEPRLVIRRNGDVLLVVVNVVGVAVQDALMVKMVLLAQPMVQADAGCYRQARVLRASNGKGIALHIVQPISPFCGPVGNFMKSLV
jgi:hypothetical protein